MKYESFLTSYVSLSIFSMYAFSAINNQHLQYLWDWNQHNLTILNGRLFFRLNPKLCMSEIHKMWDKTSIAAKPEEGDFRNNGERASCKYPYDLWMSESAGMICVGTSETGMLSQQCI